MGGVDQYFSIVALFIIFRETIEASIIVSVLLQFLHRSFPVLKRQVWWGVGMGVLVSILFGIVFSIVFYVAKQNLFTGNSKAIFKGSIAWFAGILITMLAFAMLRYRGWEDKIKRKLEALAQKELEKEANGGVDPDYVPPTTWAGRTKEKLAAGCKIALRPLVIAGTACYNCTNTGADACHDCIAAGCARCWTACKRRPETTTDEETGGDKKMVSELAGVGEHVDVAVSGSHGWGIFMVVFATVVREGVESVVFLAGVGNAAPSSIPLPGLVGFVCGISVGIFLFYTGKQVKDIKWFIIIMAVVLFFISAGQFMLGTDFLITGGMFGYASPWVNDRPWYMQPLWNFSACCKDTDENKFFALARAIFGYQDKPTFVEVMVYFGYWVIIVCVALYKWRTGSLFDADYKYKRQLAREAKLAAESGAAPSQVTRGYTTSTSLMELGTDDKALALAKQVELERRSGSGGSASASQQEEGSSSTGNAGTTAGNGGSPTTGVVAAEEQAPTVQRIQG